LTITVAAATLAAPIRQFEMDACMSDRFARYPSLAGKVVYVTGGASGIGAEIVGAFANQGAKVGFVDLDADASAALCAIHAGVTHEICDLKDISGLRTAFAALKTRIGPADVLVNNAAHDDRHSWTEVTPEYWDDRMNTNLRHQFFATQAVAPDMIEKGGGSIINMGSNSWFEAGGGFPAYATAKAAVHGLTRTMARDLGKHRIRVNAVVPGWIMTERQKTLWAKPDAIAAHLKRQCLPDLIDPVYVARMVLFLASDDAAMCTANSYMVEAGSI
jgi:NAD(P)-dependent dehydrogenase (short-subunit alcohol dehydrogenase family)